MVYESEECVQSDGKGVYCVLTLVCVEKLPDAKERLVNSVLTLIEYQITAPSHSNIGHMTNFFPPTSNQLLYACILLYCTKKLDS